jgi:hypothetical protein
VAWRLAGSAWHPLKVQAPPGVLQKRAHIHIETPRLTKEGFVARGAAAVAVAGGVVLGIRLCFHNHAPKQRAIRLPFHQQAADQLGGNLLGGAGEEGLREGLEERAGDGSGSGGCSVLRLEQTKMRGSSKPKRSGSRFSSGKPAASLKAQFAKRPAN